MERIGREERQRERMFNVLYGKELVVVHLHGQEEMLHGEVHLQLEQSGRLCPAQILLHYHHHHHHSPPWLDLWLPIQQVSLAGLVA